MLMTLALPNPRKKVSCDSCNMRETMLNGRGGGGEEEEEKEKEEEEKKWACQFFLNDIK